MGERPIIRRVRLRKVSVRGHSARFPLVWEIFLYGSFTYISKDWKKVYTVSKPIECFHSRDKQACKFTHAEQKEVLQEGKTSGHAYTSTQVQGRKCKGVTLQFAYLEKFSLNFFMLVVCNPCQYSRSLERLDTLLRFFSMISFVPKITKNTLTVLLLFFFFTIMQCNLIKQIFYHM